MLSGCARGAEHSISKKWQEYLNSASYFSKDSVIARQNTPTTAVKPNKLFDTVILNLYQTYTIYISFFDRVCTHQKE